MTSGLEHRYRRLLRVYPPTWRAENAEVVLGTLLDVAEGEGRDRPARGEPFALAVDGIAHRLDRRGAIAAAGAAFAASVLGTVLSLFLGAQMADAGLWWLGPVLQLLVVPVGIVVASAALLRSTHRIGSRSALAAVVLSLPAAGGALAAAMLWSIGFDAADAGAPVDAVWTVAMLVCLAVSIVLGTVVVTLLSRPLFRGGAAGVVLAALAALVATPIVGIALASPLTGSVLSAGVAVLALAIGVQKVPVSGASGREAPLGTASTGSRLAETGDPSRAMVRTRAVPLLLTAMTAGLAAIVLSLTGSLWLPSLDATQAMNVGLGFGGLVASVSVAVFAVRLVRSGALSRLGASIAVLAPAVGGAGQLASGVVSVDPWPSVLAGSALMGAALAFLVSRALRRSYPGLSPAAVVATSLLAGAGYAAMPGLMVAAMIAFIAPLVAGIAALSIARRRRAEAPASVGFAPSF